MKTLAVAFCLVVLAGCGEAEGKKKAAGPAAPSAKEYSSIEDLGSRKAAIQKQMDDMVGASVQGGARHEGNPTYLKLKFERTAIETLADEEGWRSLKNPPTLSKEKVERALHHIREDLLENYGWRGTLAGGEPNPSTKKLDPNAMAEWMRPDPFAPK